MAGNKKGNKNPSKRIVNVPAEFVNLLEEECQEKGIMLHSELVSRILSEHFKERKAQKGKEKITIREA